MNQTPSALTRAAVFYTGCVDGDQCKPPPCQNDGVCEDGISSYVCWCKPDFSGKNCEIGERDGLSLLCQNVISVRAETINVKNFHSAFLYQRSPSSVPLTTADVPISV